MNLRKLARGKECQVRIPGVCNFDPSTTVLAHVRMPAITGTGLKAPDELGAWCCYACHLVTEREKANDGIQRAFYEGVIRTQYELIKLGVLGEANRRANRALS